MRHPTRFNIVILVACSVFTAMLSAANSASAAYPLLAAADGKPAIAAHKVRFEKDTVELALQVLAPGKTVEAVRIDNLGGVSSLWRSDGRDGAAPLSVSQGGQPLSSGSMPMIFNPGNAEALLFLSLKDNGAFAGKNTDFRITVFFTGGERAMYALSAGDFPSAAPGQAAYEAPVVAASAVAPSPTPTAAPPPQETPATATSGVAPTPAAQTTAPSPTPFQTVQGAPVSAAQTEQATAPPAASERTLFLPFIIGAIIVAVLLLLGTMFFMRRRVLSKRIAGLLARAAGGDAKAQFEAFGMYKNKQDKFLEAMRFLSQSAEQGYAEAQTELGLRCQTGDGVEKSSAQAVEWFKKAADQGILTAQYNLALCYQTGSGIDQNLDKAVEFFEICAVQGHVESQWKVKECKAEQGDVESMYELATIFFSGSGGVQKDEEKAFDCLNKAAEGGHVAAQEDLGLHYLQGNGIQKDSFLAVHWFKEAAQQGSAVAQYNFALCLKAGDGIEKDGSLAAAWFKEAASQNYHGPKSSR